MLICHDKSELNFDKFLVFNQPSEEEGKSDALKKELLRHIGLLEVDEDKIRKIRPKGTQVRMLYVPREAIRP